MLYLLWDGSDIWGLLAHWAVDALKTPCRLVSARQLATGLLQREPPDMLLVPGGFASNKAAALGPQGMAGIQDYVAEGGSYLGICGGAGLALQGRLGDAPLAGGATPGYLALCPWERGNFSDRMQHFMSGHISVRCSPHPLTPRQLQDKALLPVWWPGCFAPADDAATGVAGYGGPARSPVSILARYREPGQDFWLADIAVASLPVAAFSDWHARHGGAPSPDFLHDQPCIIHGAYGAGSYTLSYAHLESAGSPEANLWFSHLLAAGIPRYAQDSAVLQGSVTPWTQGAVPSWAQGAVPSWAQGAVPPWSLEDLPVYWADPVLDRVREDVGALFRQAVAYGLFFDRSPWLTGWRPGLPGAALARLRALVHSCTAHEPSPAAALYWGRHKELFSRAFSTFIRDTLSYLQAERLALTLMHTGTREALTGRKSDIFGPSPMQPGGLWGPVHSVLDTLAFLQLSR